VDVENLRGRFTHDDPALNAKFRRFVQAMAENAAREARDGAGNWNTSRHFGCQEANNFVPCFPNCWPLSRRRR
jgi:hypothetical protein